MASYHLYDKIDQFLQGKLTGQELELFKAEMRADPELAQQVGLQQLANEAIIENQLGNVRSKLTKIHQRRSGTNSFLSSFKTFSIVSLSFFLSAGLLAYYMKFDFNEQPNEVSISKVAAAEKKEIKPLIESDEVAATPKEEESKEKIILEKKPSETKKEELVVIKKDRVKQPEQNAVIVKEEKQKEQFEDLVEVINEQRIKDPCATVRISTKIDITPTCEGEQNGALRVELDKTVGGKAPYFYSIDGKNYSMKGDFEALGQGSYSFYIEDADGCLNKIDNYIKVTTKQCVE